MLDQIAWLAAAVLTTSCAEVPPPAFEAELASFQCSGNDSRWYFRETYLTQDEFPACWRVAREVKGGCGARETYWTPQPGDYVPPVDPYVQVAPEPEVPSGG